MPITFCCSACGTSLTVGDAYAGVKARCKACGNKLVVPGSAPGVNATEPWWSEPLDVIPVEPPPTRSRAGPLAESPWVNLDAARSVPRASGQGQGGNYSTGHTIQIVFSIILFVLIACCLIPIKIIVYMNQIKPAPPTQERRQR